MFANGSPVAPPPSGPPKGPVEPRQSQVPGDASEAFHPFGWGSLLILITLVVVAWLMVTKMADFAKMQDCVMSGRRNCAPIDDPAPR